MLCCRFGSYSNTFPRQNRLIYQQLSEEPSGETLEMLAVTPASQKERLIDVTDSLEAKIRALEEKKDPRYREMIAVARARLKAVSPYVPREGKVDAEKDISILTPAQQNAILSDLRLSIIAATREEMKNRLGDIGIRLDKERDSRIQVFNDKYKELRDQYGEWPETTEALAKSYEIRKADVEKIYGDKIINARTLIESTFGQLGPSVDDVLEKFSDLGEKLDGIVAENKLKEYGTAADEVIDLAGFEERAGMRCMREAFKTLSNDYINILQYMLDNIDRFRIEEKKYVEAKFLADRIKKERDELAKSAFLEGEKAKKAAVIHATFIRDFGKIQEVINPGKVKMPEVVVAVNLEASPEGKKRV